MTRLDVPQRPVPVGIDQLPPLGPIAVTLGVFDGVHRGHHHLLAATSDAAAQTGASSAALVFDPHPEEVLRPGWQVPRLAPLSENLAMIAAAGIDRVVPVRFDDPLRSLTPEEFVDRLQRAATLRTLVMTPESAFGRGRAGTVTRMREIGAARHFTVETIEPLQVDGAAVSSSRIRRELEAGAVERAAELLGHAPLLVGEVVHGDGRGRELGYPTANLAFAYRAALPALGIYLGRVSVATRGVSAGHPALVSIGVRPTFHDEGRVLVEVFLLDWSGDLYGAEMRLELVARLREERRFASVEALVEQMHSDEARARTLLDEARPNR